MIADIVRRILLARHSGDARAESVATTWLLLEHTYWVRGLRGAWHLATHAHPLATEPYRVTVLRGTVAEPAIWYPLRLRERSIFRDSASTAAYGTVAKRVNLQRAQEAFENIRMAFQLQDRDILRYHTSSHLEGMLFQSLEAELTA